MTKFKIGADPEMMLVNEDGNLKSAIPVIDGVKHEPIEFGDGFFVLRDNVNAEFGIPPASSKDEFVANLKTGISRLADIVSPLRLQVRASANFPKRELDCPEALEFGCDPDFNAWTLTAINIDPEAAEQAFRSCGGHIHIGKVEAHTDWLDEPMKKVETIKMMDYVVGLATVLMDKDPTSPKRRSLYGQAGAHRPTPYGVEYRTPGNFWLHSPELVRAIYDLTSLAINLVDEEVLEAIDELDVDVRNIIDKSNHDMAGDALHQISESILSDDDSDVLEGALNVNHNHLDDLYENWGI